MRIKWRGLELPSQVIPDKERNDETYGRFAVEPFERGFGTTVGNSLRRILLSSLEGAAVTRVKIQGAEHEFTSLEGVTDDVSDVVGLRLPITANLDTEEENSKRSFIIPINIE